MDDVCGKKQFCKQFGFRMTTIMVGKDVKVDFKEKSKTITNNKRKEYHWITNKQSPGCLIMCKSKPLMSAPILRQLGRSAIDRALASHHESRGSNLVGANKCHAQVR